MSIAELRKLPRDEKLKIIEALWGDLAADEAAYESPDWHGQELRKTEAEFIAGRIEVLDWENAKKRRYTDSRRSPRRGARRFGGTWCLGNLWGTTPRGPIYLGAFTTGSKKCLQVYGRPRFSR